MLPADEIPALTDPQRAAWLQRIGIDATPAPTLAALDALIAAHLTHIPFENLDALTGRRVDIDLPSVFRKLVDEHRGGYCFELNTLFCAGLKSLGFRVTPLAARVRWNVPDTTPTGLSHMLLRVEVAHESHIADVGFGGPTPDFALPLSLPANGNAGYRLQPAPASTATGGAAFHTYELAVRVAEDAHDDQDPPDRTTADAADSWRVMYRFDLTPQPQIDFVARNWYVSTHPDSHFTQTLMVARTDHSGARLSLANGCLAERRTDGAVRRTQLESPDAVIALLTDRFGIRLDEGLRAALQVRLRALLAGSD